MKLGDTKESPNFTDTTGYGPLLKHIFGDSIKQKYPIENLDPDDLAPGGYANWITSELNKMSPEEYKMMHDNGLSIQDLYLMRMLKGKK